MIFMREQENLKYDLQEGAGDNPMTDLLNVFLYYIGDKLSRISTDRQRRGAGFLMLVVLLVFTVIPAGSFASSVRAYSESFWQTEQEKARQAVEEEPESIAANYYLALTMANLGQIKETDEKLNHFSDEVDSQEFAEVIEPIIADNPEDFDELLLLNHEAYYYIILEDYSRAVEIFEEIIEQDEDNIWARNFQAAAYLEKGELERARELLYDNLEIEKEDYTYFLLGYTYYEEGRTFQALRYFSNARQAFSDFVF